MAHCLNFRTRLWWSSEMRQAFLTVYEQKGSQFQYTHLIFHQCFYNLMSKFNSYTLGLMLLACITSNWIVSLYNFMEIWWQWLFCVYCWPGVRWCMWCLINRLKDHYFLLMGLVLLSLVWKFEGTLLFLLSMALMCVAEGLLFIFFFTTSIGKEFKRSLHSLMTMQIMLHQILLPNGPRCYMQSIITRIRTWSWQFAC